MKRICVFCGSGAGHRPDYIEAAETLGRLLAEKNWGLVYGGASVGTMGAVADAVIKNGGDVIGVMPKFLVDKEVAHKGLSDLRVVDSMHERKLLMADLSDGFIALPGGLGTLDELFEVITWGQLNLHRKPCGLLNIRQYYQSILNFLSHASEEGFIPKRHLALISVAEDAEALLRQLELYQPQDTGNKWLEEKMEHM